jgi:hypothetical protein
MGKKLTDKDFLDVSEEMKNLMNFSKNDKDEDNDYAEEDTENNEQITGEVPDESINTDSSAVTDSTDKDKTKDIKPNAFAITALALAIAGIVVSFATRFKNRAIGGVALSLLGALALLILKVEIEKTIEEKMSSFSEVAILMNITFDFQPAYYMALVGFAIASVFFILAYNDELKEKSRMAANERFYVEVMQPPDTDAGA